MRNKELATKLEQFESFLKKKDDKPFNFVEAAKYLSLSHSTLYKLTYQRKIPCHKPTGKVLYFFKSELDEWITDNAKRETKEERHKKGDGLKENEDDNDESG